MGDPEGVLGGLTGGGAVVFLPQLDMALVARNTPSSSSSETGGAGAGAGAGTVEVHPVESVHLSLVDQDPRVRKNKNRSSSVSASRHAALNFIGNTLTSFFGEDSEDSSARTEVSAEDKRRRQFALKALFKEGQDVIQLVDLASTTQRVSHDITLPPVLKHISSVQRAQAVPPAVSSSVGASLSPSSTPSSPPCDDVVRWIVSGSSSVGGEVRQHGLLTFDLRTQQAEFTELKLGLQSTESSPTNRSSRRGGLVSGECPSISGAVRRHAVWREW